VGLKFRDVDPARQFQRELLDAGLWTRVHAYHPGHRTVLTKLGLMADDAIVEFLLAACRRRLEAMTTASPRLAARATAPVALTAHESAS
jgi:hypothetical protein